jgi:hypothetical protein
VTLFFLPTGILPFRRYRSLRSLTLRESTTPIPLRPGHPWPLFFLPTGILPFRRYRSLRSLTLRESAAPIPLRPGHPWLRFFLPTGILPFRRYRSLRSLTLRESATPIPLRPGHPWPRNLSHRLRRLEGFAGETWWTVRSNQADPQRSEGSFPSFGAPVPDDPRNSLRPSANVTSRPFARRERSFD